MKIPKSKDSKLLRAKALSSLHVRKKAVEALGKIGDKKAVEPLILALKDAFPDIREEAAEALVKIGEPTEKN
jgi:HEAT repeat protein